MTGERHPQHLWAGERDARATPSDPKPAAKNAGRQASARQERRRAPRLPGAAPLTLGFRSGARAPGAAAPGGQRPDGHGRAVPGRRAAAVEAAPGEQLQVAGEKLWVHFAAGLEPQPELRVEDVHPVRPCVRIWGVTTGGGGAFAAEEVQCAVHSSRHARGVELGAAGASRVRRASLRCPAGGARAHLTQSAAGPASSQNAAAAARSPPSARSRSAQPTAPAAGAAPPAAPAAAAAVSTARRLASSSARYGRSRAASEPRGCGNAARSSAACDGAAPRGGRGAAEVTRGAVRGRRWTREACSLQVQQHASVHAGANKAAAPLPAGRRPAANLEARAYLLCRQVPPRLPCVRRRAGAVLGRPRPHQLRVRPRRQQRQRCARHQPALQRPQPRRARGEGRVPERRGQRGRAQLGQQAQRRGGRVAAAVAAARLALERSGGILVCCQAGGQLRAAPARRVAAALGAAAGALLAAAVLRAGPLLKGGARGATHCHCVDTGECPDPTAVSSRPAMRCDRYPRTTASPSPGRPAAPPCRRGAGQQSRRPAAALLQSGPSTHPPHVTPPSHNAPTSPAHYDPLPLCPLLQKPPKASKPPSPPSSPQALTPKPPNPPTSSKSSPSSSSR